MMSIFERFYYRLVVVLLCVFSVTLVVNAQENNSSITLIDTLQNDTNKTVTYTRLHSPKKASLLSACLPGAGQIYNKKYWKLPIVYVGFGVGIYFNRILNSKYQIYKKTYNNYRNPYLAANKTPPQDSLIEYNRNMYYASEIRDARDYVRKYRDLASICIGAWYLLSIIDANVDAYLYEYDVSDNLTFRVSPMLDIGYTGQTYSGISFTMNFGNKRSLISR